MFKFSNFKHSKWYTSIVVTCNEFTLLGNIISLFALDISILKTGDAGQMTKIRYYLINVGFISLGFQSGEVANNTNA